MPNVGLFTWTLLLTTATGFAATHSIPGLHHKSPEWKRPLVPTEGFYPTPHKEFKEIIGIELQRIPVHGDLGFELEKHKHDALEHERELEHKLLEKELERKHEILENEHKKLRHREQELLEHEHRELEHRQHEFQQHALEHEHKEREHREHEFFEHHMPPHTALEVHHPPHNVLEHHPPHSVFDLEEEHDLFLHEPPHKHPHEHPHGEHPHEHPHERPHDHHHEHPHEHEHEPPHHDVHKHRALGHDPLEHELPPWEDPEFVHEEEAHHRHEEEAHHHHDEEARHRHDEEAHHHEEEEEHRHVEEGSRRRTSNRGSSSEGGNRRTSSNSNRRSGSSNNNSSNRGSSNRRENSNRRQNSNRRENSNRRQNSNREGRRNREGGSNINTEELFSRRNRQNNSSSNNNRRNNSNNNRRRENNNNNNRNNNRRNSNLEELAALEKEMFAEPDLGVEMVSRPERQAESREFANFDRSTAVETSKTQMTNLREYSDNVPEPRSSRPRQLKNIYQITRQETEGYGLIGQETPYMGPGQVNTLVNRNENDYLTFQGETNRPVNEREKPRKNIFKQESNVYVSEEEYLTLDGPTTQRPKPTSSQNSRPNQFNVRPGNYEETGSFFANQEPSLRPQRPGNFNYNGGEVQKPLRPLNEFQESSRPRPKPTGSNFNVNQEQMRPRPQPAGSNFNEQVQEQLRPRPQPTGSNFNEQVQEQVRPLRPVNTNFNGEPAYQPLRPSSSSSSSVSNFVQQQGSSLRPIDSVFGFAGNLNSGRPFGGSGFNHQGSNVNSQVPPGFSLESANQRPQHSGFNLESVDQRPQPSSFNLEFANQRPQPSGFNLESANQRPQHSGFNLESANQRPRPSGFNLESVNYRPQPSEFNQQQGLGHQRPTGSFGNDDSLSLNRPTFSQESSGLPRPLRPEFSSEDNFRPQRPLDEGSMKRPRPFNGVALDQKRPESNFRPQRPLTVVEQSSQPQRPSEEAFSYVSASQTSPTFSTVETSENYFHQEQRPQRPSQGTGGYTSKTKEIRTHRQTIQNGGFFETFERPQGRDERPQRHGGRETYTDLTIHETTVSEHNGNGVRRPHREGRPGESMKEEETQHPHHHGQMSPRPSHFDKPNRDEQPRPSNVNNHNHKPGSNKGPSSPSPSPATPTKKPSTHSKGNDVKDHANIKLLPVESCGIDLGNKIIGGTTTQLDEFPWMALLQHTTDSGQSLGFGCGGSLISPRYVLTAAHCIKGPGIKSNVKVTKVRLGEFDTSSETDCQGEVCSKPPVDVPVETIIVHPEYKATDRGQLHDIALIRLRHEVETTAYISPICLPLNGTPKNLTGERLTTAGWGRTANGHGGKSSKTKLKVSLPGVNLEDCAPFYKKLNIQLKDTQMCAGGEKGKDSCQGDSGGPLMRTQAVDNQVRWQVDGIVSFGPDKCGVENVAGVYTKVSEYLKWILDNLKK